jgi:predicted AAA+ superfamily ATPase
LKSSKKNIKRAYTSFKHVNESDLKQFLKKGAFPKIAYEDDDFEIKKYVKNSTVEKLIFEDLPKIFPIENIDKVYDILINIVRNNGYIINYSNLGSILQLSKDTVKRYVFFLEKVMIITSVSLYGSYTKALRKGKKFYSACSPIAFAYQDFYEPSLVENVVLNKIREHSADIRFYRDSLKREVDFVVDNIPIEVKWKNEIYYEDLKSVFYFLNKYNLKKGIVVAKKFDIVEKNSKKIYIFPLDFFLLLSSITDF